MEPREKELIALAVSVAAGCEPCTEFHYKAAREAGGSDAELRLMIETALAVRERATMRMAAVAWSEAGVKTDTPSCGCTPPGSKIEALASAAAALAANCGSGVQGFIAIAVKAGADERDAEVALGIARHIKKVAAQKAEAAASGEQNPAPSCGCSEAAKSEGRAVCC